MKNLFPAGLVAAALVCSAAVAQTPSLPDYLKGVTAAAKPAQVGPKGGKTVLRVTVKIAPGWHIYANKPGDEFAIPTTLELKPVKGVKIGAPRFSAATAGDGGVKIHEGDLTIDVPVVLPAGTRPGTIPLVGTLKSQGCNATSCLPPSKVDFRAALKVVKK